MKGINKTHGFSRTKLYIVWQAMIARCHNPNVKSFKNYGDRGIKVCPEWKRFESFKIWADKNGYKKGVSIDRIDNDEDYCPENCQLIPLSENIQKRHSKPVICLQSGKIFPSATEASKFLGLRLSAVSDSINKRNKCGGYVWRYL